MAKGLRGFKKQAFGQVKEHQNPKLIQAAEFEAYINHPKKQVLQIDYAMAYQCELQNETMRALWTREVLIYSHVQCIIFQTQKPLSKNF